MECCKFWTYHFEWFVKEQRYNFILCINAMGLLNYRQISNIRRTKSQNLNVSLSRLAIVFVHDIEARC